MKKIALYLQVVFYLTAGINHFWHPLSYYGLIPPYLPRPGVINLMTGMFEILFSSLLFFPATRKLGAYGIILMLVAFIPAHIYFIQRGSCLPELCVPQWVGWLRLILLQPLLMGWAWWCRK
jgi:uncharacterized membrane protein